MSLQRVAQLANKTRPIYIYLYLRYAFASSELAVPIHYFSPLIYTHCLVGCILCALSKLNIVVRCSECTKITLAQDFSR